MIEIDLTVESGAWPNKTYLETLTEPAISAAAQHLPVELPEGAEVSVVFTNDAQVQALNKEWRDIDRPTNVLSFAANEGGGPITPLLGDIVLAFETITREADEQNKSFDHHLTHLVIHGFLHLVGYDHINDDDAEIMESIETKILGSLNISDPYSVD